MLNISEKEAKQNIMDELIFLRDFKEIIDKRQTCDASIVSCCVKTTDFGQIFIISKSDYYDY